MSVYKELGTKLKSFISVKTEEVDDKVEAIDKHERYVNTELDYCHLELNVETPASIIYDTIIPFNKFKNGNMEYNIENCSVKLKAGKTYEISVDYVVGQGMVNNILYDITNQSYIGNFIKNSSKTDIDLSSTSGAIIYTPETDCEIQVKASWISSETCILDTNNPYGYFIVKEINRQIVIDPVEHVNDSQGIEDTPVGHVISHMGTVAPKHYLICDGTEYNIEDYPYLAQHIEDNFGSINFFGGDGEITFAVPDLRGEFLRGTGTALRDSGNGDEVGVHQDATQHFNVHFNQGKYLTYPITYSDTTYQTAVNQDKTISVEHDTNSVPYVETSSGSDFDFEAFYTSRPTNTSVLYCIKYEPTYFMNTYNTNYMQPSLYSEEERVIGCWINGKPLYQKTIKYINTNIGNNSIYEHNIDNIDTITDFSYIFCNDGIYQKGTNIIYSMDSSPFFTNTIIVDKSNIIVKGSNAWDANENRIWCFTIQYTKTTDEENSFTNDMLKDSYVELTYSNEEIADMVADILGGEE